MNSIILTIVIIAVLFLLYLSFKAHFKSNLMLDNSLLQSETTSNLIDKIEGQELAKQEERLMKNARYRALKTVLNLQVTHYKSLSLAEVEKSFKSSKIKKQVIHYETYIFELKVSFLPSKTSPALHIVVKPKTLLGALFSVDKWIRYT